MGKYNSLIDKFFIENYNSLIIISKNICNGNHEYMDIAHEAILELKSLKWNKQKELLEKNNGVLSAYIRNCKLFWTSPTSRYQRKYHPVVYGEDLNRYNFIDIEDSNMPTKTKLYLESIFINNEEENTDFYYNINSIIDKLPPDQYQVVKQHIRDKLTFDEIVIKNKISRASISIIWKAAKENIIKEYQELYGPYIKIGRKKKKKISKKIENI